MRDDRPEILTMPGARIRATMLAFSIVLLLIACSPLAFSTTYTVDPAGPITSINAAIARAANGDNIVVHSGTYYETVRVDRRLSLTGVDTGGGRPLVDGVGHWGFEITASGALVEGFEVRNATCGVLIDGLYDHSITGITLRDNRISGISGDAIQGEFTDGNRITGNVISKAQQGVLLYSSKDYVIAGNTISDITAGGIVAETTGNEITGNILSGCRGVGIAVGGSGNTVADNTAHDCGSGIDMYDGSGNYLTGNIAYRNEDGIRIQGSTNNVITGNTIYDNARGLWLTTSRNNEIRDNVFRDNAEAIHSDASLGQNALLNNTIAGSPTKAVPTSSWTPTPTPAAGPQPTVKPPTPMPGAGKGNAGEISGALIHYGLIIGIVIIVLGAVTIGALLVLIVLVTWDEKRQKR